MVSETPALIRLRETDSTNRYLQEQLQTGHIPADETIVITDFQTAGRGQTGNTWESEAGQNLTFSLLYHPASLPANESFRIAQIAALSVKRTLDRYVQDITVKWPNDVYHREQKICGILIENLLSGKFIAHSILGIGLNINQQNFRSDAPNPVSLAQITGKTYDRMTLLEAWHTAFRTLRRLLETGNIAALHAEYLRSLYRRDGFHRYQDACGAFEARIVDIEPDGHYILERRDGMLSRYAFKEVSFI